jgi:hypothetical protein
MAVYKIFAEKDTTLYSDYKTMNTGLDPILELTKNISLVYASQSSAARILIKFSDNDIADVKNNYIGTGSYKAYLKMYMADSTGLPVDYTLEARPIYGSWDMGTGQFGNNPITTDGTSWQYRTVANNTDWTTYSFPAGVTGSFTTLNPGGGNWYTSSVSTQSFGVYTDKDVSLDVSTMIASYLTGSLINNGFLIKTSGSLEFDPNYTYKLNFFSRDTNTIYPPVLEFRWDDSRYNVSGSTATLTNSQDIRVSIANNKGDFIWGACKKAGVSYRTYGEFADNYKANIPVLENHFCSYYTSWDQKVRDTTRVNQWKRDFDSLVAINALPQLNTFRIINDHTEGMSIGRPTPFAHTADNDLAVGMFVDYLSKSPVWKESVVFILEDDAQNGPDHVDAHRSPAYVVGPYVKRNFVDHTPYTTSGILRTMELILGVAPMSQFDAGATPLWRCFTPTPNFKTFNAIPSNINLSDKNVVWNELSERSAKFDLSKEDRVPDNEFSEVIWKGVKGLHSQMPAPRRAAFIREIEKEDDKD